jgi:uncharacterized protein YndB with AHSA1/START domain
MGNETHEPVQQSVHVDVPVEDAFRLFTESFRDWWPGDESERSAVEDGAVTLWDPPTRIEFTWQRDGSQTVSVEFDVEADGTRVTLTHYGWETSGVARCAAGFARFVCEQMAGV